jgi:hypothetical protein
MVSTSSISSLVRCVPSSNGLFSGKTQRGTRRPPSAPNAAPLSPARLRPPARPPERPAPDRQGRGPRPRVPVATVSCPHASPPSPEAPGDGGRDKDVMARRSPESGDGKRVLHDRGTRFASTGRWRPIQHHPPTYSGRAHVPGRYGRPDLDRRTKLFDFATHVSESALCLPPVVHQMAESLDGH